MYKLRLLFISTLLCFWFSHGEYHASGDILHWFTHVASLKPEKIRFEEVSETTGAPVFHLASIGKDQSQSNLSQALLVFGEHAREIITSEVALWLSKALVGEASEMLAWKEFTSAMADVGIIEQNVNKTIEDWTSIVLQNLSLKIIPIENFEGRKSWENGNLCLRKTPSGVDLNRNWPYAWKKETSRHQDQYGGPHPLSEPQSRLVKRIAQNASTRAYINVHSGEWAYYVPWDSKPGRVPGLKDDVQQLLDDVGRVVKCMAGPAGAVSSYLAFGTSMDYMFTTLQVPYALTVEVYGGGREGLLAPGAKNKPISAFPLLPADRRLMRRSHPASRNLLSITDPVMTVVNKSPRHLRGCFLMFNPHTPEEYRNVISRWVVALLITLKHVAIHDRPDHPGTAATDANLLSSGRKLMQDARSADEGAQEKREPSANFGGSGNMLLRAADGIAAVQNFPLNAGSAGKLEQTAARGGGSGSGSGKHYAGGTVDDGESDSGFSGNADEDMDALSSLRHGGFAAWKALRHYFDDLVIGEVHSSPEDSHGSEVEGYDMLFVDKGAKGRNIASHAQSATHIPHTGDLGSDEIPLLSNALHVLHGIFSPDRSASAHEETVALLAGHEHHEHAHFPGQETIAKLVSSASHQLENARGRLSTDAIRLFGEKKKKGHFYSGLTPWRVAKWLFAFLVFALFCLFTSSASRRMWRFCRQVKQKPK